MTPSITDSTVKAAIAAIASESATTQEKIEMLIELAHGLQKNLKLLKIYGVQLICINELAKCVGMIIRY